MIVFSAQLKVRHHHGYFRTRYDHNNEHEEQEAEQIVILILPYGRENEKELDEAGAKRQNSRHQCAHYGIHVPDLIGHLARYLIGAYRLRVRLNKQKTENVQILFTGEFY